MEEMFIFNSPAYFDVQIGQVRLRAQCKLIVDKKISREPLHTCILNE